MVSPSRSRFSANHALVALQDVFFSRILVSLHDLVRLDFLSFILLRFMLFLAILSASREGFPSQSAGARQRPYVDE